MLNSAVLYHDRVTGDLYYKYLPDFTPSIYHRKSYDPLWGPDSYVGTITMPVSSLKSMARRACVRFVRNLESVGDVPVELVESIINKIDNPDQLRRLEENSPQVVGHTKEGWINLIKRDIPNFEARMPGPDWRETIFSRDNADKWWKVYRKLKKAVEKENQQKDAKLAELLGGVRRERDQQLSEVVNRPVPKANPHRLQTATYHLNRDMYVNHPSRASSGQGFFEKLNRNAVTKSSARMRTPNNKLKPLLNNGVKAAPIALVEDIREKKEQEAREARLAKERTAQAKLAARNSTVPRRDPARGPAPPLHAPGYDLTKDREARLRNLKSGGASSSTQESEVTKLTENFLEGDDDSDVNDSNEDLFGSSRPVSRSQTHQPASPRPASPFKGPGQATKQSSPPGSQSPLLKAASGHKPMLKRKREEPALFRSSGR